MDFGFEIRGILAISFKRYEEMVVSKNSIQGCLLKIFLKLSGFKEFLKNNVFLRIYGNLRVSFKSLLRLIEESNDTVTGMSLRLLHCSFIESVQHM